MNGESGKALTRKEGIGSRAHVEDFMLVTRSVSAISLTDVNEWLGSSEGLGWVEGQEGGWKRRKPAGCEMCQFCFGKMTPVLIEWVALVCRQKTTLCC